MEEILHSSYRLLLISMPCHCWTLEARRASTIQTHI
uniref:Uncharacterized protein n=1 Tax=Setaria italica TaxID=4555 RepID=K4AN12_SETIT